MDELDAIVKNFFSLIGLLESLEDSEFIISVPIENNGQEADKDGKEA